MKWDETNNVIDALVSVIIAGSHLMCLSSEELGDDTSHTALFSLLDLVHTVSSHTGAKRQQVHGVVVVGTVNSFWNVVNDT